MWLGVGEGARPALPCLDDLTSALDPTLGSLFVIQSIRSQQLLRPAPILIVVCGNSGLSDFERRTYTAHLLLTSVKSEVPLPSIQLVLTRRNRRPFTCARRSRPHREMGKSSFSRMTRVGPLTSLTGRLRRVNGSEETANQARSRQRIGIQCRATSISSRRTKDQATPLRCGRRHGGAAITMLSTSLPRRRSSACFSM